MFHRCVQGCGSVVRQRQRQSQAFVHSLDEGRVRRNRYTCPHLLPHHNRRSCEVSPSALPHRTCQAPHATERREMKKTFIFHCIEDHLYRCFSLVAFFSIGMNCILTFPMLTSAGRQAIAHSPHTHTAPYLSLSTG